MGGPTVTLGSQIKGAATTASVTFTPAIAIMSAPTSAILITLSGSPTIGSSTCTVTTPAGALCTPTMIGQVLKVVLVLPYGGIFASGNQVAFNFNAFTNPAAAQAAMTAVAAATTSDGSVFLDASITGTFPAILTAMTVNPAPPFVPQMNSNGNSLNVQVASGQFVPAGRVTITLSGVGLDGPSPGSATGITVSTSKDALSAGVASGRIGGQVAGVSWAMTVEQRYCNRRTGAAVVTVGFTLATAYSAPGPNQVTISFPLSFFQLQNGTGPTVTCTDVTGGNIMAGITVTIQNSNPPTQFTGTIQNSYPLTQLVLSSSSWNTVPKICVFSDLATGPVTPGGLVSVQSTQDFPSWDWSGPLLQ